MTTRLRRFLLLVPLSMAACADPESWVSVEPEFIQEARQPDDASVFFDLTVKNLTDRTIQWDWRFEGDGEIDMSIFRIGPLEQDDSMRVPFAGFCGTLDVEVDHISGVLEIETVDDRPNSTPDVLRQIPVELDCR